MDRREGFCLNLVKKGGFSLMSLKMPQARYRNVCRVLGKLGFVQQPKNGGHTVFKHNDGRQVAVPDHGNGSLILNGTLRAIIKKSGVSRNEFIKLL